MALAPIDLDDLRAVPLLARLDEDALLELRDQALARRLRKGEVLWRAGDAGDDLVVVLDGELEVLGADGAGGEELIARLGRGEHVGELALLLGERRSATVVCSVPATVLSISSEAFDAVVKDDRALALLSEVVARRAVERLRRRPVTARLRVVAVVGEHDADPDEVAAVADAIVARTPTLVGRDAVLVPRSAFWDRSGTPGPAQRSQNEVVAGIAALRVEHAGRDLCVVDLGTTPVEAAAACCDIVVRVTDEPRRHGDPSVLTVVTGARIGTAPASCDPFVLSHGSATTSASLDRLVRKLFGVTVGLALGGGAAFGIAHVGVIQALEHAGIDIDLHAGTSFGSIVAIGSAAGLTGDDMAAIAARIGNVRTTLSVLDPAADGSGLLAGRRLVKIFAPLLEQERFDELAKPCRVVATDIESGERVAIGDGRLDDAFRASCSIPLVFSPVVRDGRTLVDGAMVDPVPAEVVREMGADIVIAVNVVPRLEKGATTALSRAVKTVNRFNPLARRAGTSALPGVVDVLMNSLQVVQYELGRFRSIAADVPIEVDLAGFTWIDFPKATQLVARGFDAGRGAAPLVRAAVASRSDSAGGLDEQRELVGER